MGHPCDTLPNSISINFHNHFSSHFLNVSLLSLEISVWFLISMGSIHIHTRFVLPLSTVRMDSKMPIILCMLLPVKTITLQLYNVSHELNSEQKWRVIFLVEIHDIFLECPMKLIMSGWFQIHFLWVLCRDGPWPNPTQAFFWPAVNKRLTWLWPGYFSTRIDEIFFDPKLKKILGENFQT